MKKILFIGQEPDSVDFSDPALPAGLTAEKISAGIDAGLQQIAERGWHADLCLVYPDGSASHAVREQLAHTQYDCIVIGGGIRIPPKSLQLFEALINTVHQAAPGAFIAFNTSPEDTGAAAARWLGGG